MWKSWKELWSVIVNIENNAKKLPIAKRITDLIVMVVLKGGKINKRKIENLKI
jgi:hypothetical protein